jgi:hypothetical protein
MASSTDPTKTATAASSIDMSADPFVSNSTAASHHRYSNFDSQLFALGPGASAEQAKRALEAHLRETERRMEEAGKLGTALVQQQRELTERLKEVEELQAEGELAPELRQKLVDIEKDYNDVARESARAFLPKQRIPSNESAGSPFVPDGKGRVSDADLFWTSLALTMIFSDPLAPTSSRVKPQHPRRNLTYRIVSYGTNPPTASTTLSLLPR